MNEDHEYYDPETDEIQTPKSPMLGIILGVLLTICGSGLILFFLLPAHVYP